MKSRHTKYVVNLVRAGVDGAASARRKTSSPPVAIDSIWAPAAFAAVVGASAASMKNSRRPRAAAALGGLCGIAFGLGCGLAWTSRAFTRAVARGAVKNINLVRDAHWLERHPIDYA